MIDMYETPYKNVHINVAAPKITVRCSGGFDSAVLLYLVAKACNQHNPTAVIQPITVIRTNNPDNENQHHSRMNNLPVVDTIVEWTRTQFPNITINDKMYLDTPQWWENGCEPYNLNQLNLVIANAPADATRDEDHARVHNLPILDDKYIAELLDFNGVTKNPPIALSGHEFRELSRDIDHDEPPMAEDSCSVHTSQNILKTQFQESFRNTDKRVTIYLARELNIFDKLNEITVSCEGNREATDGWTRTCDVCWWCLEREWAISEVQ